MHSFLNAKHVYRKYCIIMFTQSEKLKSFKKLILVTKFQNNPFFFFKIKVSLLYITKNVNRVFALFIMIELTREWIQ